MCEAVKTQAGPAPEVGFLPAAQWGARPERRRSPRHEANYFGVLTKLVEGKPRRKWLVKVEDVSLHGLCFRPVTNTQGFLNIGDTAVLHLLHDGKSGEHLVIRNIRGARLGSEFIRVNPGDRVVPYHASKGGGH